MRRPSQKLHFEVLPAQLSGDRRGAPWRPQNCFAGVVVLSRYGYFHPICALRPVGRVAAAEGAPAGGVFGLYSCNLNAPICPRAVKAHNRSS
jgi:hypothetical protein